MNCPLCNLPLKEGQCSVKVNSLDIDFAVSVIDFAVSFDVEKTKVVPHYMIIKKDDFFSSYEKFKLFDLTIVNAFTWSGEHYSRVFMNNNLIADLDFHIKYDFVSSSREEILNKIKTYQIFS